MSRTDKTDPWWVRRAESPLSAQAVHRHHLDGDCDLPEVYERVDHATRCYWAAGPALLYGRGGGCGCRLCTEYYERRQERRRQRREARAETQRLRRLLRRLDELDPDARLEG